MEKTWIKMEEIMKRMSVVFALLLFAGIALVSCNLTFVTPNTFSPPTWIQGSWVDASGNYELDFTAENVTASIMGVEYDYGILYRDPQTYTVTETMNSQTEYAFTVTTQGATIPHRFIKISPTQLRYEVNTVIATFTKQ